MLFIKKERRNFYMEYRGVPHSYQNQLLHSNVVHPITKWYILMWYPPICFHSKLIVSKSGFLFPMTFHCFENTIFVSKLFVCLQSTFFPMFFAKLHITVFTKKITISKDRNHENFSNNYFGTRCDHSRWSHYQKLHCVTRKRTYLGSQQSNSTLMLHSHWLFVNH